MQDDRKIVKKVLFGIEKMTRTDNKIALCKIQFNLNSCKNLPKDELDALSDTTTSFFHFIQAFGKQAQIT